MPARAYVFDAYGTLFDVHSAIGKHREKVGAQADAFSELWRVKQLEYSWTHTLMDKYVHPLYALRENGKGYEVAVMKEAMEILGMKAGPVRPPLMNVKPEHKKAVRDLMEVYRQYQPEA